MPWNLIGSFRGPQGTTGSQGPKGDTGSTGPVGPSGVTRISGATDYDQAAPAPVTGNGLGWYQQANGGQGGWQPQPFLSQYQRGVIGGVLEAGNVAGTWTPVASAANDQAATANAGDVAIGIPTAGTQGQRLLLLLTSTGASRTWTLAAGIASVAGVPRSVQVPTTSQGFCLLRWNATLGRWTCLDFTLEG